MEHLITPDTDESHAEDDIDDESLGAALDEMLGKEKDLEEETPETQPLKEEEPLKKTSNEKELEEQRERSQLGRKVAKVTEDMDYLKNTLYSLNEKLDKLGTRPVVADDGPEDVVDFDPSTPEGFDRAYDLKKQREQRIIIEEQQGYEKNYVSTMSDLLGDIENDKVREMAKAELVKQGGQFNKRLSNDPSRDCAKNLNGVLKHLRSVVKPATVFDKEGRALKVPAGVSGGKTTTKSTPVSYDLDEYESAVSKGLTAEEIDETLRGEEPINLTGSKRKRA